MELIARGHGDNDFFMDPVGVEWPWRLVLVWFFFRWGKRVNECEGEHYMEQGHLLNM